MPRSCAPLLLYVESLSAAHAFAMVWRLVCAFCRLSLTSYNMNCFLIFHFLLACSFQGLGLAWLWVFPSLAHPLLLRSVVTLLVIPLCYSCRGVIWLVLAGPFWAHYLFFSQWLNIVIGFILMLLWAFLTYYIACGNLSTISLFFGIFGPFAFLGHPRPIF